jgi:hypothetical protein
VGAFSLELLCFSDLYLFFMSVAHAAVYPSEAKSQQSTRLLFAIFLFIFIWFPDRFLLPVSGDFNVAFNTSSAFSD